MPVNFAKATQVTLIRVLPHAPQVKAGCAERCGKRRIRMNVWGNWNGYEGTRKVREFGTNENGARSWANEKQAK